MLDSKRIERARKREIRLFLLVLAAIVVAALTGCASASPQFDTQGNVVGGTAYGFFRDMEIEQIKADGSRIKISSKSTTADIMNAGNQILGTMAGIADKAK